METSTPIRIGDRVSVRIGPAGLVRHDGVCVDFGHDGVPFISHASKKSGKVEIVSLADFANGARYELHTSRCRRPIADMQQMARDLNGHPYSLLGFNCEHYANHLLGHGIKSQQITLGLVAAGALWIVTRSRAA